MTITATTKPVRSFNVAHPLCQGDFAAIVFSGDRSVLGELPSELTAETPFKFAMVDPRLDDDDDFARSYHMPLPRWDVERTVPTPGVCFLFSDAGHPGIATLADQGAVEGEHYCVVESVCAGSADAIRSAHLAHLMDQVPRHGTVLLLGFGDQGSAMAAQLRMQFQVPPSNIAVVDSGSTSARQALMHGYRVLGHSDALDDANAVIYTPLLRYEPLYELLKQANRLGLPTLDNSSPSAGGSQFRHRGIVSLEDSADRAIIVRGSSITADAHGLPIEAWIVREDLRRLAGASFRDLHGGQRATLSRGDDAVNLDSAMLTDGLASHTFGGLRHAWVSLRRRAFMPVFAARDFALNIWPEATYAIFPSPCVADLGATRFERLIKRHVDGQEIIMAAQTSIQQVILGIVARHYAHDTPLLEIGSALGGSGMIMAAATDEARPPFISVDPQTASRHIMRFGFEQIEQGKRLQQIVETSDKAIHSLPHLQGQAGLVFIDGLHTESGCAADFRNYASLVRPGGVLLIHDAEPARYSVLRVLIEQVLPDPRFEMKCLVDGLAVLERRQ